MESTLDAFAEIEHAAGGKLRGPENLYENITKSTIATIDNSFPASKGEVRATDSALQNELTEVKSQFKDYKNETTALINSLVREVNALTPVCS